MIKQSKAQLLQSRLDKLQAHIDTLPPGSVAQIEAQELLVRKKRQWFPVKLVAT